MKTPADDLPRMRTSFFDLPQEVRDHIYDFLLDQPVLQLVSSSQGHQFRRVVARKIPRSMKVSSGLAEPSPPVTPFASTKEPEPTYAKSQVRACTSALLLCKQTTQELKDRAAWRAKYAPIAISYWYTAWKS